jgi:hypothetical protein
VKAFRMMELDEALTHAAAGEQALHLHQIVFRCSPRCFRQAVARGEDIGHLFDLDRARLVATAKRLGIRKVVVDREGTDKQHVDLCGAPLFKALAECEREAVR